MVTGTALAVTGVWQVVAGRNVPGVLGRRLYGDRIMQAPAIYFRATGTFAAMAGISAFWLALMVSVTSAPQIVLVAVLGGPVVIADLVCLVWLLVLTDRYKLWWKKP